MTNQKAIIDLGSLKAKLMVFDKDNRELLSRKSYLTLLGKNIMESKRISSDALNNLDLALKEISEYLKESACQEIDFIATESLRVANNHDHVGKIVTKHFGPKEIRILTQENEAQLFFEAVSRHFQDREITCADIGGGSVQVIEGKYDSKQKKWNIINKTLAKTGTYMLQQKYSPNNELISRDFGRAIKEIEKEFKNLSTKRDILVFGSTCMQDFIIESGINVYGDRPMQKHELYITQREVADLMEKIRSLPPNARTHFYPSGGYFIYGADYLLANLIEIAKKTEAKFVYPTNLNSSYGLI